MKIFITILLLSLGIFAQTNTKKLNEKLNEIQKKSDFPGFAVAVVNEKGILYQKGFGYADMEKKIPFTPETSQPIGSVSKTFIGVALMKAIDDGKLTLETNISDILPFKIYNPNFPKREIKIKHLVTHTSGIIDREEIYESSYIKAKKSGVSLNEFFSDYLTPKGKFYDAKNFSRDEAGTNYQYSNIASALAAYVIEVKTGMPFDDYTRKFIFKPLRMKNTGWFYDDVKNQAVLYDENKKPLEIYSLTTYPDGGLRTTVTDLSKYMFEVIKGSQGNSKFLSKKSFEIMFRGQFDEKDVPKNLNLAKINRAVFWETKPGGTIGHNGSDPGVTTFFYFNEKTKTGRIFITNADLDGNEKLAGQFLSVWKAIDEFAGKPEK